MNEHVDILVFAAHPDDAELSCAGTIMKHIANGAKVAIVDLTQGELGSRGTIETRYAEAKEASQIMGVSFRENLKMQDGWFEINEENKRLIIEQIRRFQPKVVLANSLTDRHPDHGRGGKLVSEACFLAGLRKIETTWKGESQNHHRPDAVYHYIQDYYIKPDFVVDVTKFVDRKLDAIKAYKTQFFDPDSKEPETPISGEDFFDFIKSRMREMGRPAGMRFAEGFTAERFIGVEDVLMLK
ncbi:MAG TPA: bacillithiol biosynthesis deacetylase BshB1 [Crocinitomicaceae bacterium]|nr:bacillithiol biosynthesis deacetylase BshB1 [Crocinitomicaceae bacterium]